MTMANEPRHSRSRAPTAMTVEQLHQEVVECRARSKRLAAELTAWRGLAKNPHLTPVQQKVLRFLIEKAGFRLGQPIPERASYSRKTSLDFSPAWSQ
jgi:hypothetical protein